MDEYDGSGLRCNPLIVLTSPRRAGKSELILLRMTDKCLFGPPNQRCWITAQNGMMARERWEDFAAMLQASPIGPRLKIKHMSGAERILFPNGSQIRPFSPTADSIHGLFGSEIALDECWSFDPIRGQELMAAIGPTTATQPGAQIIITSTAGTSDSTWFHDFVNRGRAGDPAITFLEWSAPDEVTIEDPDQVAAYHPAVGYTITKQFIRDQAGLMVDLAGEFERAYANRRTVVAERIISATIWNRAVTTDPLPAGRPCFGVDVAFDRSETCIVAACSGVIEVVEQRPGFDWAPARMAELVEKHNPAAVVCDTVGPSGVLADSLSLRGIKLYPMTAKTVALAAQSFLDGLETGVVKHRRHAALDAAADAAAKRPLGDAWTWSRRRASASIAALVAAGFASWADTHRPAEPVRPLAAAG